MLIGLSATLLLLLNGRVAGISGILGRVTQGAQMPTNAAFVVGPRSSLRLAGSLFGFTLGRVGGIGQDAPSL